MCPNGSKMSPGTWCLSNFKLVDLGLVMYATDYDDRAPMRDGWMDLADPYVKNQQLYHCPEVHGEGLYGYAMDSNVRSTLVKPETTPFVYDSMNLGRSASDPFTSLPNPGRHGGRNVVGFVDGHANKIRNPEETTP